MNLEQFKKKMKQIPDGPGVYFFLGKSKEVLYIGKATSLRSRVRSYFSPDLAKARGPLLVQMLEKAKTIDWRETDSVLEALLLEANLIKTHKPKHNTDLKDDKSWNYVVITKDSPPAGGFPVVKLVRGKELEMQKLRKTSPLQGDKPHPSAENFVPLYTFGPFPHGLQLKAAMKIIRKIFPYRDDKCTPCAEQGLPLLKCKPCFNRHIGLCPGVCTGEISKTDYRKIIRRIALLFEGKKPQLIKSLEKDMKAAAKAEEFEEAARLRSQVFALNHIQDVSLIKDEYRSSYVTGRQPALRSFSGVGRIEAYDIAHMGGTSTVGVMVVVEDGQPNKDQYRKFKIKTAKGGDDAGSLREVLTRRLGHDEWPLPRVIAVDGSTAQINTANRILEEHGMAIPVVGVVKDEKHRPRSIQGKREVIAGRERDILLANAEAHRFAITYHKKLRNPLRGL